LLAFVYIVLGKILLSFTYLASPFKTISKLWLLEC